MTTEELFKKLKPNPDNPRRINKEELGDLLKKIKRFPKMLAKRPIVYDSSRDYIILGGNQRLESVKILLAKNEIELKAEYFADCADWTDEEKREFIVIDNVYDGEWDWDKLANQYEAEELEEWGLETIAMFGESDDKSKERLDQKEDKYCVCPNCGHKDLAKKFHWTMSSEQNNDTEDN